MLICWAVLGGFVLDAIFGDPAWLTHPVVIMGRAIAALESGLTAETQKKDRTTMPGMSENPFDKVFLVPPAGTDAAMTERLLEKARYHFDAELCGSLAEAVELARANSRRGLLVCGSEAIALEALKLFS